MIPFEGQNSSFSANGLVSVTETLKTQNGSGNAIEVLCGTSPGNYFSEVSILRALDRSSLGGDKRNGAKQGGLFYICSPTVKAWLDITLPGGNFSWIDSTTFDPATESLVMEITKAGKFQNGIVRVSNMNVLNGGGIQLAGNVYQCSLNGGGSVSIELPYTFINE